MRTRRAASAVRAVTGWKPAWILNLSTGGGFLAYGDGDGDFDQMPILYVTSEGQAGKVASNLSEWLAIVVAVPYWQDLLKFSGGGDLAEMPSDCD